MLLPDAFARLRAVAGAAVVLTLVAGCQSSVPPSPSASASASPEPSVSTAAPSPTPTATSLAPTSSPSAAAPDPTVEPTAPTAPDVDGQVRIDVVEVDRALGVLRVHAQISGIAPDAGTCTATATGPGDPVSVTVDAMFNVDRTECAALELPLDQLGAGDWSVEVEFALEGFSIAPATQEVTLP